MTSGSLQMKQPAVEAGADPGYLLNPSAGDLPEI